MKTIIGLYWRDEDVRDTVHQLKEMGFTHNRISTPPHLDRRRLTGDLGHPVARYAALGSLIGIAIYAVFGLGAAVAGCTYCGFDLTYVIGTVLGFLFVGGLAGAFLGQWLGFDASERDIHVFTRALQMGARLVAVQADDDSLTKATGIMRGGDAVAVTLLHD